MSVLTSFSAIAGATVLDAGGEVAGTVAEIMLTSTDGSIAYVALSVGGVLGVGERLFAVPWSAFAVDPLAGEIRLSFPATTFDDRDGFDKDAWPTVADDTFT